MSQPSRFDIVVDASTRRASAQTNAARIQIEVDSARKTLNAKLEALAIAERELKGAESMLLEACQELSKKGQA